MKPNNALQEYIKSSELRVIIDGVFSARMSSDIAKNFDAGKYNIAISEHKKSIVELETMNIIYPAKARPVFYMYIVPDENFIELLNYPYKDRKGGGRPVDSYDMDSFNSAYGTSQNLLDYVDELPIDKHINNIHEYAHLIQGQFGYKSNMFAEGFAELVPWYVLEYEKLVASHVESIKGMKKIYTANELLNSVSFSDRVPGKTCSFQPSYVSSYLWVRSVVEHIRVKYNLSRIGAVQKFLELYRMVKFDKQWFVMDLANEIDMDVDKLLDSVEYQVEQVNQIIKEVK